MVRHLRICLCAHAYLDYDIAQEYILYSAWASRCPFNTKGNAKASTSGTAIVQVSRFFYVLMSMFEFLVKNLDVFRELFEASVEINLFELPRENTKDTVKQEDNCFIHQMCL